MNTAQMVRKYVKKRLLHSHGKWHGIKSPEWLRERHKAARGDTVTVGASVWIFDGARWITT